jgi:predicted transcriptional regulator
LGHALHERRGKMIKRRSSDVIISQILEVCAEGASKTRIVYQSNLNFSTVNPYLDLLLERGLLEAVGGPRTVYKTTKNGIELMKSFKHYQDEISKLCTYIENVNA